MQQVLIPPIHLVEVVFTTSNIVNVSVLPVNTYYRDQDNDGFGHPADSLQACSQPSHVFANTDCDDNNNSIYPGHLNCAMGG
ncbi:MAG: hypothetical protein IPN26_10665 [Bacteroidetes bacterium]|nr:hypothetical protein [Bacteroidota bacterium]